MCHLELMKQLKQFDKSWIKANVHENVPFKVSKRITDAITTRRQFLSLYVQQFSLMTNIL